MGKDRLSPYYIMYISTTSMAYHKIFYTWKEHASEENVNLKVSSKIPFTTVSASIVMRLQRKLKEEQ